VIGTNFGCVSCHALTVSSDTVISNAAKHGNGLRDYSGARAGSYNSTSKVCSNVYCHSDGKATFKSMTSANWASSRTLDCKGCHGSDATPFFTSIAGEPNYSNGGAGDVKANSHNKHVTSASSCVNCHSSSTTTGTSIKSAATSHINGTFDVSTEKLTWGANKTCSNISCHDAGFHVGGYVTPSKQWGATVLADCSGCHGNKATASSALSGAHNKHMNDSANGGAFNCIDCHSLTVSNNTTISDTTKHMNGFVNFSGTNAGRSKTCSSIYCHSNGKGGYASIPTWSGTSPVAICDLCHAAANLAGSHSTHISKSATCDQCHNSTTTTG
jgi:predicted CxxxxCH...CXXCH cytochrome family protein